MTNRLLRAVYLCVIASSFAAAAAGPFTAAVGAIVPTASPGVLLQTPPPLSATATPSPSGHLLRWSGQILDDRRGFVFFTTGDGFRLDPQLKVDDAASGGATLLQPVTRVYARASFDTGNGRVVELSLSHKRLPDEATYDQIRKFAIALSTPAPNPDLAGGGPGFTGRAVLVAFTVEVPSRTPFADEVYIATDVSGWSATAIRMDRVDALHYRVSREFASGTILRYRYTRGSWRSSERNQAGMEPQPHTLVVKNVDVEPVRDIVYSWGDQDQSAPDLGNSIPTPFNPIPFNTPPPFVPRAHR
jgi:hypothetical protein